MKILKMFYYVEEEEKNKILLKKIQENSSANINFKLIDDYKIDGDFVESQAFAFLAVRSVSNFNFFP